uniref:Uncharacterized protein n=1 Tax=Anguilla anguilla TaxID=7936 RepID=A0A0E9WG16_ANGAN
MAIWPGKQSYHPYSYDKCHGIFKDHSELGLLKVYYVGFCGPCRLCVCKPHSLLSPQPHPHLH